MICKNPLQDMAPQAVHSLCARSFFGHAIKSRQLRGGKHVQKIGPYRVYARSCNLRDAFSSLTATVLAARLGAPVASSVVHKVTGSSANGFRLYSIAGFDLPVTLAHATASHIRVRPMAKDDVRKWMNFSKNLPLPSQEDRELLLFKGAMRNIATLLPFQEWIGENDIGTHNCVVSGHEIGAAVLDQHGIVFSKTKRDISKGLRLYGIDTFVRESGFRSAPEQFAEYMSSFETPHRILSEIEDSFSLPDDEKIRRLSVFNATVCKSFLPHVDWKPAREMTNRILELDHKTLSGVVRGVAQEMGTLSGVLPRNLEQEVKNIIKILTTRQIKMDDYKKTIPQSRHVPLTPKENPFSNFSHIFSSSLS